MSPSPELTGLPSVRALLAQSDPAGALVPCELRDLVVGPGALAEVVPAVVSLTAVLGRRPLAVLLVDETLILREGEDVKGLAERLLAAEVDVRREVLSDGHPELHVTADVVDRAVEVSGDADVLVALGGGTISDIGKLVAARRPGIPLVTVMTAASVDGYTDNVSVTLADGVKRTVPSVWPDVVIADAETVAGAPARMTRAGYGEMTSMYVAPADWRLAELVGTDPAFHRGPVALLAALSAPLDACAPGVAAGDPDAVQELTWALALRGIATGVAGTTACLSGVEHVISHMLDLRAAELHLPTGLHGEQVGVGSVVAAVAWELLNERLAADPGARVDRTFLDADAAEVRVRASFDSLDATGRIGAECWRDYSRKLATLRADVPRVDRVLAEWGAHVDELQSLARPSSAIAAGLRSAGAPLLMSDLPEGIDPVTGRWAIESCALMRDRFTVVDLLTILGWWQPSDVDEVLARTEAVVAAAGTTKVGVPA